MSKIAIILVGHLRSWKSCKEQFMKYFNKYDPDIYALTYDTINYNSEEILSEEEIKESLKDINIVKLTIKKQKEVFEEAKNKYGKFLIEQNRDINTLTWGCQILNLQSCYNDIINSGIKYDYIIKTRFDVQYLFDETSLFIENQNFINISSNHDCCDIFACGKFDKMHSYCNIADNVEFLYNSQFKDNWIEMNPHILLYYNFAYSNIRFNSILDIKLIRL
jgi:hypothetical protein